MTETSACPVCGRDDLKARAGTLPRHKGFFHRRRRHPNGSSHYERLWCRGSGAEALESAPKRGDR